jgi:hypothetical protein
MFGQDEKTTFQLTARDLRAIWDEKDGSERKGSWLERMFRRPTFGRPVAA